MLTVGKLKKWLDEKNIPDDAYVFLGYKKKTLFFQKRIKTKEQSVKFADRTDCSQVNNRNHRDSIAITYNIKSY